MYVLLQCVYVFMNFCSVVLCQLAQVFANILLKLSKSCAGIFLYAHAYIHSNKNYIDHYIYCIDSIEIL